MHSLCSRSRPLLSFMASASHHCWPPTLAGRVFSPMESTNPPVRRAHRTALEATDVDTGGKPVDVSGHPEEIVISDSEYFDNWYTKTAHILSDASFTPLLILPKSSHRDGCIYKRTHAWKEDYRIEDRNETCLEAMMLTEPPNCFFLNDQCLHHKSRRMFQIFSVKLAQNPVGGIVQLYGYIAVRDMLDPLLNYVVNITRDDPIIVKQGSLINMTGPKRGIDFLCDVAIEYDMRIKTGEEEKNDLQLIDGASIFGDMDTSDCHAITKRIHGDCGAIDIALAHLERAVEATIEVVISEVQSSFSLRLGCLPVDARKKSYSLIVSLVSQDA